HDGGRDLLGRLVQAGVDDLEPGVPQRPGDDLRPPVVAVETGLGDHHPVAALHESILGAVPRQPPKPMTMVLMALGAVAAGVALFVVVLAVAGPKTSKQAQTATFKVGSAKSLAGTVARTGPLLFQDLLGGSRDIYVQHLDDDKWTAFEAHAPGQPRTCFLRWQAESRTF